jgi:UDP-N-acetylglucosamine 2-epimerase (non-hydrolysing)
MKVFLVAGARPNFMKIAPIYREMKARSSMDCRIVHTGQHYDYEMSQAFFEDLELPEPDFFLDAGSASHAEQTAKIMVSFEKICMEHHPDHIIVVGDVNSTLACTITAKKLCIQVSHVEAGLRSFDLCMPEEINRMVTDSISDLFFVTEDSGRKHLLAEGKKPEVVHNVGHVMIDNLLHQNEKLKEMDTRAFASAAVKPAPGSYIFLTLHRPSNVDDKDIFQGLIDTVNSIAEEYPVIFPIHPRTRKQLEKFGLSFSDNVTLLKPLGFREALFLWKDAKMVLTDSGGLQEETTALKVPCITLRENTERPITLEVGSNRLAGNSPESIMQAYQEVLKESSEGYAIPDLWDGNASKRIVDILEASGAQQQ